jgi:hypothetical protein
LIPSTHKGKGWFANIAKLRGLATRIWVLIKL